MPELPEVETIVGELKRGLAGATILDATFSRPKLIKNISYPTFRKTIKGKTIQKIERRAKYILIHLSGNKTLILHLGMTGRLLLHPQKEKGQVVNLKTKKKEPDRFIRGQFFLNKDRVLDFSDLRLFGRVYLVDTKTLLQKKPIKKLGVDPLSKNFTYSLFTDQLAKRRGKVKTILMNQTFLAGIGNIYSDEILFEAKIHPLSPVQKLKPSQVKTLYAAIKKILKKGVRYRGTSDSDYFDLQGETGNFQKHLKVYGKTGQPCFRCPGKVERLKVGGRSAHFCSMCQH
ncbi:MAG: bifunctional DNA-formamidopyrimidine glycosylase/DNA-(apurinic or apyrimidinic site) lyase [Patescibacteria group bacterium]